MSWRQLLASNRVHRHATSRQELDNLRAIVARDLQDASLPGLSADRTFATAYNAALQLAKMALACAGYRVAVGPGHHQTTFEAVKLIALGRNSSTLADYFDTCRRKRNVVDYDTANVTSDTEATELLQKAEEFRQTVEAWINQHHANLAP
jgi:uncharacterized protein (UPF0332 family)